MIIEIIILLLAIPSGHLIAWLARDELIQGRNWFRILIVVSILLGIFFYLVGKTYLIWTMSFVFIVSLISLMKSSNPRFIGKR